MSFEHTSGAAAAVEFPEMSRASWSTFRDAPPSPRVAQRWTHHCEDEFEHMVLHDPGALLDLLRDPALDPSLLTYAAEIAGDVGPAYAPLALVALDALLTHPRAFVREGAIYGLGRLARIIPAARSRIEQRLASGSEASEAVAEAARSVLGVG